MNAAYDCQECGMLCDPPTAYHPYLYCELRKLGHLNPEQYLAMYGFTRHAPVLAGSDTEDREDA